MHKSLSIPLFITGIFLLAQSVSAQVGPGMMGGEGTRSAAGEQKTYAQNLDEVLEEILSSQNIQSISQIDCTKISDGAFERLGDAWMERQIGNTSVHKRMDQMMGGEGSENLKDAHIKMGKNYLDCSPNGFSWMMPMMFGTNVASEGGGFPMMGWGTGGFANMMNGNLGFGFGLLGALFWLVVLFDLILLGIFLWKKIQK